MKSRITISCILLFLLLRPLAAQQPLFEIGLWKQQSLNGAITLEGLYRSQETIFRSGQRETPVNQKLLGQFEIVSRSYIWHPNLLKINIDLKLNPGIQNERFLVIPNRSERRTAEQLRIQTVIFDQRSLSANAFYNINHHFINREYATNVEAVNNDYGGGISFRNPFLPVTLSYIKSDWTQDEIQTGRQFLNKRENISVVFNKSLGQSDRHLLSYAYDDYIRKYGFGSWIGNKAVNIRLENHVSLDSSRYSNWHSLVYYRRQKGSQNYERLQINENITYALPASLKFTGLYRYNDYNQFLLRSRQNNIVARMEHKLYSSLRSYIYYEYIDLNQTFFDELTNQIGIGFEYTKKIPTGTFQLSYEHRERNDDRKSESQYIDIVREEYILKDNEIILLNQPDIDPATVIVRDESGSIIYQENIDYLIISRAPFLEIQRLPGGQISEGQTIYIDYTSRHSFSFNYDTNYNIFRLNLTIFNRLLNFYFRYFDQRHDNIFKAENKILKSISQRVYGLRLSRGILSAGLEFDNYESNIVPYHAKRYYLTVASNFLSVLNLSLSSNYRDYKLLASFETQQFADISGRLIYFINTFSKVSLDGGYRFQEGRGIDLDLSNLRAEFTTRYRSVYLTFGLEMYRRNFSQEITNYNGGYIKIERKF